jgi:SPP1 gp7 family putative phage head morphogenesis protein
MAEFDVDLVIEDINTRLAKDYVLAFREYLVAVVLKNAPQTRDARLKLEEVVRESMGRAEILGALSTLRSAAKVLASESTFSAFQAERNRLLAFADTSTTKILSRVTFLEAVEDLVDRVPVTLRGAAERTSGRIAELYSADGGVIAFAHSAESAVTQRARELITKGVREGIPERDIGRVLAFNVNRIRTETEAWTEGYARMAFRTNLNDAVSQGRLRQARDPDIKVAIPALRYTAVGDGDTRSNHNAADGVILAVDNPTWRNMRPPFGYNCRCQLDNMSRPELRRMGRLDAAGKVIESRIPGAAKPDDGFRPGGTV